MSDASSEISLFFYITSFVGIISVLVFIHEFGHYGVAKLCGVRVEEFSIGFGPKLVGIHDKSGTLWKICLIPMGGYVKMFGDVDPASSPDYEKIDSLSETEKKYAFYNKPLWQKAAVVIAGPLANYILAIIILASFYNLYGKPLYEPIVAGVAEDMPAQQAGLQEGDRIIAIDNKPIESFTDIISIVALNTGTPLEIRYQRENIENTVELTPQVIQRKNIFGTEENVGLIGIQQPPRSYKTDNYNVFTALGEATIDSIHYSGQMLRAIGQIITGQRSIKDLGGPVKIAKYSGKAADIGLKMVLWLMAMISISLGLFNLLPIPVLDGGHLLFYTIESIQGRPLAEKFQKYSMTAGMVLLLSLTVLVTYNDILTVTGNNDTQTTNKP